MNYQIPNVTVSLSKYSGIEFDAAISTAMHRVRYNRFEELGLFPEYDPEFRSIFDAMCLASPGQIVILPPATTPAQPFSRLTIVIDDLEIPIQQLIYSSLLAVEQAGLASVMILEDQFRFRAQQYRSKLVNHEALRINEIAAGVARFVDSMPKSIKLVSLAVSGGQGMADNFTNSLNFVGLQTSSHFEKF